VRQREREREGGRGEFSNGLPRKRIRWGGEEGCHPDEYERGIGARSCSSQIPARGERIRRGWMTGVEGEVGEGEKGKRGQTYQIDTRRKARAEQRQRAALYLRLVHREIRMLYYMYVCLYVCVCVCMCVCARLRAIYWLEYSNQCRMFVSIMHTYTCMGKNEVGGRDGDGGRMKVRSLRLCLKSNKRKQSLFWNLF